MNMFFEFQRSDEKRNVHKTMTGCAPTLEHPSKHIFMSLGFTSGESKLENRKLHEK